MKDWKEKKRLDGGDLPKSLGSNVGN